MRSWETVGGVHRRAGRQLACCRCDTSRSRLCSHPCAGRSELGQHGARRGGHGGAGLVKSPCAPLEAEACGPWCSRSASPLPVRPPPVFPADLSEGGPKSRQKHYFSDLLQLEAIGGNRTADVPIPLRPGLAMISALKRAAGEPASRHRGRKAKKLCAHQRTSACQQPLVNHKTTDAET